MLYELPYFEYFEPTSIEDTLDLLQKYKERAKILAGGTDLLGLMKDRVEGPKMPTPSVLVNVKKIRELNQISHDETGSMIGTTATLSRIAKDVVLKERYPAFVQAAGSVATGHIRNMGTLGGNLCQRPWCWYFRHPAFNCFKKGGKQCYAITGDNSTYFSVYNLGTCVMGSPSDTAPALMSLGATVKIASREKGTREIKLSEFFLGGKSVQDNILQPEELLVSVKIPRQSQKSVYLKQRIRNNWDFALASVAAAASLDGQGNVDAIKLVLGGVAPMPLILDSAEEMLLGKKFDETSRARLDELISSQAKPLRMNKYKVRIVRALIRRALQQVLAE